MVLLEVSRDNVYAPSVGYCNKLIRWRLADSCCIVSALFKQKQAQSCRGYERHLRSWQPKQQAVPFAAYTWFHLSTLTGRLAQGTSYDQGTENRLTCGSWSGPE